MVKLLQSDIIIKMASSPEEPTKLNLEEVKRSVETTLEAKMTIDNFFERSKRAMDEKTDEKISSNTVTLHSIEGNTYKVKFEVELANDVS